MSSNRYTDEELAWLRESYPKIGLRAVEGEFEKRFGYRRSQRALAAKAYKMGLRVQALPKTSRTGAVRRISWDREPGMTAWMLANDNGRIGDTCAAFEREFGFPIAKTQVSLFRRTHGTISRKGCGGRWGDRYPLGSRRDTGKGYVLVKVADRPGKKGTKDNWRMEHVVAYEAYNGPVPEGCQVMFADHDYTNIAPGNLVAVPKKLIGIINEQGLEYSDRESFLACVRMAELKSRIVDCELAPRRCEVCGVEFAPKERYQTKVITCPDCLAAGRKAKGRRRYKKEGEGL